MVSEDLNSAQVPSDGCFALGIQEDPDSLFYSCCLRENYVYQLAVYLPWGKDKCAAHAVRLWPFRDPRLEGHLTIVDQRFWPEVESGRGTIVPAVFNPGSHVGVVDLSVYDDCHALIVEILCSKITYPQDFDILLEEVAAQGMRAIYALDALSAVRLRGVLTNEPDPAALLFHLRQVMRQQNLPQAVETILSRPVSQLSEVWCNAKPPWPARVDLGFIVRRASTLKLAKGGFLERVMQGYTPQVLPILQKAETYDTPENRYVKAFLNDLLFLLSRLQTLPDLADRPVSLSQLAEWGSLVADWLTEAIWRDVGSMETFPSNSQRLQRLAGYRDVLYFDQKLREALTLPWLTLVHPADAEVLGDVRPIFELYELWCFLVVRGIARELFTCETVVDVDDRARTNPWLGLFGSNVSHLKYKPRHLTGDVVVHLFLSRPFPPHREEDWGDWSGSYSGTFYPDISLAVQRRDLTHWILFDAKYRMNRRIWTEQLKDTGPSERPGEQSSSYRRIDLYKMHTYRDAVLGTRGAYVLYPGTQEDCPDIFVRSRSTLEPAELEIPSIGAFPLSPASRRQQRLVLKDFIDRITRLLMTGDTYTEEYGLTGNANYGHGAP